MVKSTREISNTVLHHFNPWKHILYDSMTFKGTLKHGWSALFNVFCTSILASSKTPGYSIGTAVRFLLQLLHICIKNTITLSLNLKLSVKKVTLYIRLCSVPGNQEFIFIIRFTLIIDKYLLNNLKFFKRQLFLLIKKQKFQFFGLPKIIE